MKNLSLFDTIQNIILSNIKMTFYQIKNNHSMHDTETAGCPKKCNLIVNFWGHNKNNRKFIHSSKEKESMRRKCHQLC